MDETSPGRRQIPRARRPGLVATRQIHSPARCLLRQSGKPLRRRIVELLYKLRESPAIRDPEEKEDPISNKFDYDSNSEKPFRFSQNKLIIHKNLFLFNQKNKMGAAVRQVNLHS